MNNFDIQSKNRSGSALIIVVVLVVMLSIVGFLFVMLARLDAVGSGSIAEVRQMEGAAQYVVERIADVIAEDAYSGENYDYPGDNDRWLASIEPYFDVAEAQAAGTAASDLYKHYKWRRISDFLGVLGSHGIDVQHVTPRPEPKSWSNATNLLRQTIDEYQEILVATEDDYKPQSDAALQAKYYNGPADTGTYQKGQLLRGADIGGKYQGQWADADGDGVADSKWFVVPNLKTADGQDYYAAVRIIDNSGMINVNTAYRDGRPGYASDYLCDGASQLNTNLEGLLNSSDNIADVFAERGAGLNGMTGSQWLEYKENVVDRLSNPHKAKDYAIFTTPDEISLRDRFCINPGANSRIETILEKTLNGSSFTDGWGYRNRPYMGGNYGKLVEWCFAITGDNTTTITSPTVNPANRPDRRHLLTTMSKSREMTPEPQIKQADLKPDMEAFPGMRKAYINAIAETADIEGLSLEQLAGNIYYAIKDADFTGRFGDDMTAERVAWHFALNLVDYQNTTVERPSYKRVGSSVYFGFDGVEGLLDDSLFVSEVAHFNNPAAAEAGYNSNLPENTPYYMLEIYNPSTQAKEIGLLNNYTITVGAVEIDLYVDIFSSIPTTIGAGQAILIANDLGKSSEAFGVAADYEYLALTFNTPNPVLVHKLDWPVVDNLDPVNMPVDKCEITLDTTVKGARRSAQRVGEFGEGSGLLRPDSWTADLTKRNFGARPVMDQNSSIDLNLMVAGRNIYNIGEIGDVFAIGAYSDSADSVNDMSFAAAVERAVAKPSGDNKFKIWGRFDFTDEQTQKLFDYLTVFRTAYDGVNSDGSPTTSDKPKDDGIDNDNDGTIDNIGEDAARYYETVVHGRININTAPRKVLEQLPFMTKELAAIITARRDSQELYKLDAPAIRVANYTSAVSGYRNIAQVLEATLNPGMNPNYDKEYDMQRYGQDGVNLTGYPDFDPDGIVDDYRERDILFHRISNSITVKSDVFTAYILLRAGAQGPQQRMIVIYDRSNVYESGDKPAVIIQQASQLGR